MFEIPFIKVFSEIRNLAKLLNQNQIRNDTDQFEATSALRIALLETKILIGKQDNKSIILKTKSEWETEEKTEQNLARLWNTAATYILGLARKKNDGELGYLADKCFQMAESFALRKVNFAQSTPSLMDQLKNIQRLGEQGNCCSSRY